LIWKPVKKSINSDFHRAAYLLLLLPNAIKAGYVDVM